MGGPWYVHEGIVIVPKVGTAFAAETSPNQMTFSILPR
jgi:hypothetical protein